MSVKDIGFKLTAARRASGRTQAWVALQMGTTQSAISRVESGGSTPSLDFLDRYVSAIGGSLNVTIGNAPLDSPALRARRVQTALRGYEFNPWRRDPTPSEQRMLIADGLTRERFES